MPQFCRDLLAGFDTTVSHRPVNPFPNGIQCQPKKAKSVLTIHGLWPNYNDGYPACCNVTDSIANKPFPAFEFSVEHAELLGRMSTRWIDATQRSTYDTLCEIHNHEFQKHGVCYDAFGEDFSAAAANYFQATLDVADIVEKQTKQVDKWAKSKMKQIPSLAVLKALYPKKPAVYCSAVTPNNHLSVVRTCWNKIHGNNSAVESFEMIDCPAAAPYGAFVNCNESVPIALTEYTSPTAIAR